MIPHVLDTLPFRIPANSNTPAVRQRILNLLRAADNDNPAPPRADPDDDRAALLKPEFAPRLIWKRLREVAEGNGGSSNWYVETYAFDDAAPSEPEASVERLWPIDALIRAAHDGVDYQLHEGRIIPYGGRSGDLEYSETTGRMIQVGKLVLADDLRTEAANDDEPEEKAEDKSNEVEIIGGIRRPSSDGAKQDKDDEPEPLGIDQALAALAGEPSRRRGNVSSDDRFNARVARAGSITKIRHRDKDGKPVTLTHPRNVDGAYRERETDMPPPIRHASAEDGIDARQRLARLQAVLSPETVAILDFSVDAPSFEAIGEFIGKSSEAARKAGRRALVKACKKLDEALKGNKFYYAA